MPDARTAALTALTMIAFAGNSLLCRLALIDSKIDAASFTSIRLISGAVVLWLIARFFRHKEKGGGNWWSALALFAYAACFSFAYLELSAATGALLLFGAVQTTMIGYSLISGERLRWFQIVGLVVALAGLIGMLLPGLTAPPILGAALMLCAGVAWGVYSLLGKKKKGDSIRVTAGNFLRGVVFAVCLNLLLSQRAKVDASSAAYAIASGAVASGLGYAIWYTVLPALKSTTAATVQLSVPVIAAVGGILFLPESLTLRLVVASVAILGGIALVVIDFQAANKSKEEAESGK